MRGPVALAAIALALLACGGASGEVVRGVPASKQSIYADAAAAGAFKCLDGVGEVAFSGVNDDYCDCADGSDEPGTSACLAGQFYCVNKGHRGRYLPSAHVNDGICDCCDGSDEWSPPPGSAACSNVCEEAGADYRQQRAAAIAAAEAGARIKLEYIEAGRKAKEEAEEGVKAKEAELESARADRVAQQEVLTAEEATEKAEREAAQKTKQSSLLSGLRLEELDADALRSILVDHARATNTSTQLVELLRDRLPEREQAEGAAAGGDADGLDETNGVTWVDDGGDSAEYERPEAAAAREAMDEISDRISRLDDEIAALKATSTADYGPEGVFYGLAKRCISYKVAQYTYEVCPYKDAKQDHTSLGSWEGFEDDYKTMVFKNGQHCWNGPMRSLAVHLTCGSEEKVYAVDEPSTCVYTARMSTPAVCDSRFAKPIDFDIDAMDVDAHGNIVMPEDAAASA